MALLSSYYYGYSAAIDDLQEERVIPHARGEPIVPEVVWNELLEQLARDFGDKH